MVYNDVIIADRGFNIAKRLGTLGTKLEIPRFTKGQDKVREENKHTHKLLKTTNLLPLFKSKIKGRLVKLKNIFIYFQ